MTFINQALVTANGNLNIFNQDDNTNIASLNVGNNYNTTSVTCNNLNATNSTFSSLNTPGNLFAYGKVTLVTPPPTAHTPTISRLVVDNTTGIVYSTNLNI